MSIHYVPRKGPLPNALPAVWHLAALLRDNEMQAKLRLQDVMQLWDKILQPI